MSRARGERQIGLPVEAPFHLEATVRLLQRRAINRVDRFEAGRYLRLFETSAGPAVAVVENHGSIDAPRLVLRIAGGAATRVEVVASLRRVLGLDRDARGVERIAALEPRLAPVARALRGMRPPRFPTLFETVANVIPFQQVSLDSGAAIVGRIVEALGASAIVGGRELRAFPRAEHVAAAGLEPLRSAGLSQAKARSLHGIAERIAHGTLDEARLQALSTDAARAHLVELPGLGPWSAGLVLLRGLGRLDAFPAGDVGVARGLRALLAEAEGFDPLRFAERFGPLRGLLYFFSLGASLLARGLIHSADGDERASLPPSLDGGPSARG